jgi:hypothetical protein
VALTISIADFSLSSSPSSATVTAGQSAPYTLSVTPAGGFNQQVSLSCTGAPSAATCSISPSPVTLDGTNAARATVTVTTTAQAVSGPARRPVPPVGGGPLALPWAVWLLMLTTLGSLAAMRRRRIRLTLAVLAATTLIAISWAACGGGGGGSGNPGTPPGTYTLTVTATHGALSHSTTVTLKVN